jgi:hypothetical protein
MDHWSRAQDSPVQCRLADAVEVGAMRPVRRGDPGEIDPPSTSVIKVEQGRAAEKPADGPIVGGRFRPAQTRDHEALPSIVAAVWMTASILEDERSDRSRSVCSTMAFEARPAASRGRTTTILRGSRRPVRHVPPWPAAPGIWEPLDMDGLR